MTVKRAIVSFLIAVAFLTLPLQFVIDSSAKNIASVCIVLASSLSVLLYIAWTDALETQPLSTFAIFGYCLTTQLGALLAQTSSWTALTSSLYDPLYTFSTLAMYQAIALLAHTTYRFFSISKPVDSGAFRRLLYWAGLYRVPSAATLQVLGCFGLIAFVFSHFQGVAGKIVNAFTFLTWAPFLIPIYRRNYGDSYAHGTRSRLALLGFVIAAVVLGLVFNTRAIMFSGLTTIGLIYLFLALRSNALLSGRSVLRLGAIAVILIAVSVPMANLASAMVLARSWRGKISSAEMVQLTFHIWRTPNLIDAARAESAAVSRYVAYDETYLSNPLIARFIGTKYHDNMFRFARTLTTDQDKARLRDVSIQLAWAGLPTPLLRIFGIGVVKEELGFSMGDYLAYLSRGIPLGGRKIGSMFAQGMVLFGPMFPCLYAVTCLGLFAFMDLLTIRSLDSAASISALGLLEILPYFRDGLVWEGLHDVVYLFMRNFLQMVIAYLLAFGIARLILRDKRPLPLSVADSPIWQHSL